jgi:hypothetical protein
MKNPAATKLCVSIRFYIATFRAFVRGGLNGAMPKLSSVCVRSANGRTWKAFLVAAACGLLSSNAYADWNQFQLAAPNSASTYARSKAVSRIPNSK